MVEKEPNQGPDKTGGDQSADAEIVNHDPLFLRWAHIYKVLGLRETGNKRGQEFSGFTNDVLFTCIRWDFQTRDSLGELLYRVRRGAISLEVFCAHFQEVPALEFVMERLNAWITIPKIKSPEEIYEMIDYLIKHGIANPGEILQYTKNDRIRSHINARYPSSGSENIKTSKLGESAITIGEPSQKAPDSGEVAQQVAIPVLYCHQNGQRNESHHLFGEGSGREYTIGTNLLSDAAISNDQNGKVLPNHATIIVSENRAIIAAKEGEVSIFDRGGVAGTIQPGKDGILKQGDKFALGSLKGYTTTDEVAQFELAAESVPGDEVKNLIRRRVVQLLVYYGDTLRQLMSEQGDEHRTQAAQTEQLLGAIDNMKNNVILFGTVRGVAVFEKGDLAAQEKGATSAVTMDLERKILAAVHSMEGILRKKIDADYATLLQVDRAYVESDPECIRKLQEGKQWEKFAGAHNISLPSNEKIEAALGEVVEKAQAYLIEKRAEAERSRIAEGTRRRANDQLPTTIHARALEKFRKQYAEVHCAEGELIDELTAFGFVGPVLKIENPRGDGFTVPLLRSKITVGTHNTNTIVLEGGEFGSGTDYFLAELEYDIPEKKCVVTWLGGDLRDEKGHAPLTSQFELGKNSRLRIGRHKLSIDDNHAFTERGIHGAAKQEATRCMEIIFDLEDTSQKQKIDAFDTIKGLLSRGLINRDFMQAHFRPSLGFMWRNITKWQIAEAERDAEWQHLQNPGASLQDVHNLLAFRMMIREKGKIFPSVEYKPENLELEVERRVGAFADADAQSKAPLTMKLKLQKRIHPDDKEVAAELENKRECGEKADVGVVQIARMIETGLAERNAVVKRQGIRREYAKRIEETVKIRSDFARFQKGGVEAAKLYPEMRASVKGKTVREVLSVDEVKNNNLQMPFPVRMDSGMPEYVAKFAVIVARNCFRQALTADDPRQQMTELKAFIGEREGDGIIVKRDLLMPPCLSEDAIDAKMEEMEGRAVLCEQERKAGREAKRILDAVNLAKKTTAEKAANVINLAREEQRLDLLLDPETVAIMTDPQLESEMDSFEISPVIKQSVNQPSAAARTSGSGVSAVAERIDGKLIIYETTQKGKWGEVQKVYRKLVMQLAQNCAQGIMEGENASAQLMLIQKAVNEFHLFKLEDIGINQAQIDAGLDIERARLEKATKAKYLATYEPLKKSALTSKLNDFKSLDQYGTLAGISDPVEAEVLRGILDEICVSKLTGILENLRKGFDTGYMKILAAKMKAKGFEIERHFSDPADLALLQ